MLPNFLIIGAKKAGTTSLFRYLSQHPQVYMPAEKELNFFHDPRYERRGMHWYEQFFADTGDARAVGEASPGYSAWPWLDHVPERAAAHLPGVKVIYLMRHPVERLISQYRFDAINKADPRPIEEAVLDDRLFLCRSRYSAQIEHWLQHVDRDRMLLLTSEALRADREATLRRVLEFLDVDAGLAPANVATEFNQGELRRRERTVLRRVRGAAAFRLGRRLVPAATRHAVWTRLGTTPAGKRFGEVQISDDFRRELVDRLRDDLVRLPGHMEAGFDCWGLLQDPLARVAPGPR